MGENISTTQSRAVHEALRNMPARDRVAELLVAILCFDRKIYRCAASVAAFVSVMSKYLSVIERIAVAQILRDQADELVRDLDKDILDAANVFGTTKH